MRAFRTRILLDRHSLICRPLRQHVVSALGDENARPCVRESCSLFAAAAFSCEARALTLMASSLALAYIAEARTKHANAALLTSASLARKLALRLPVTYIRNEGK